MKTNKERQAALRKRRAEQGITRHEYYYHKDDHKRIFDFVRQLNEKRLCIKHGGEG